MDRDAYVACPKSVRKTRVCYMRIGSATNTRTMKATVIPALPSVDTAPSISGQSVAGCLHLCSFLNSFAYDYVARKRCGGLHLDFHYIEPTPVPLAVCSDVRYALVTQSDALALPHPLFAPDWLRLRAEYPRLGDTPWQQLWAIDDAERLRRQCILDAIVAELYGLEYDDFAYVVRIDPDDLTGFWRVDKDLPDEHRHTTLALRAFRDLKEMGLEAFCAHEWQLPSEAKAFRDARQTYTWTPTEDWSDCEQHARNIIGDAPEWTAFEAELERIRRGETGTPSDRLAAEPKPSGQQTSLDI